MVMRDRLKHYPVNWIDGMKINKNHFIAQDDAWSNALHDVAALPLTPLRYGILPPSAAGENTFNVTISLDNQNSLRVALLSCQAVTSGGIRISLPAFSTTVQTDSDAVQVLPFPVTGGNSESLWWVILASHPFEKKPAGSPDTAENPPRFPNVLPAYTLQVVSESNYRQFAHNPYALTIGKVIINGKEVRVDEDYIPPCISISAHPDLVSLHSELDQFLSTLEMYCSQIVQKIFKKNQQNDISELVMFLCDRVMLHLGQAITAFRWMLLHEPPALLFAQIASLARVMKNTIDLRTGSGKDELMNYLSEWCELKQGEFENMLSSIANVEFNHNDINKSIQRVIVFVKVTAKLFETLSKLEFIGKRKDAGIFVKEEPIGYTEQQGPKTRRRFFG